MENNVLPAGASVTTENWKAALYLRLSKEDGDKEESESITNQRSLLLSHVNKLADVKVVSEAIDDGWSGATFARPAFTKMMEDIRAGRINCVIVKDLSRFGRSFGEAGKYIEHVFPFLNVRFISVNDGIDSNNKKSRSDEIVIPFLNLISDAYCRDISIKIRSQLDIKRKKGDFVSAFTVYGYKRDEHNHNRLVVDENAADIVKLIFQWKLDGLSSAAISNKLNELGTPSPMAYKKEQGLHFKTSFAITNETKWSPVAVYRILRDETYTGMMVQGKSGTPNHKIKKKFVKPANDWARVDGMHEPIISLDDFNLVAKVLERDTRIAPASETVYPFSGIVKCGLCGENMIRKTVHTGGKRYIYFVCCRGCKGVRIKEDTLIGCVKAALQSHIQNIVNLDRVLRFIDELPLKQDEVLKLDRQINAKRAEIERYEKLVFSLYESLQSGIINEAEYRQMKSRYNTLQADSESAIASLNREINDIMNAGGEKNQWIERFKQYRDFTVLTRRMVVSLVDAVTVYPGTIAGNEKTASKPAGVRLDILFRYRYDFERSLSFANAVNQLHKLPGQGFYGEEAL